MNNGSTGNAPFAPNYTPPCGEDCTCGAGWKAVTFVKTELITIPSETETEVATYTYTETETRVTGTTLSEVTKLSWVGTHEEEYEREYTFENGKWISKFVPVTETCVKFWTEDVFWTTVVTESTVVEEEYSVLTTRAISVPSTTNIVGTTEVRVPGEGEETTVVEATRVADTVVTRTRTELTIPFTDGEEEYTTVVTTLADVGSGYFKAGAVVRVSKVDDESYFVVCDSSGKQILKQHVSATIVDGVWRAGTYEWRIPKDGVYVFRMEYIKNWGSVSNVGEINVEGALWVTGKTETQVESILTRAVSVPGDTTVTEVEYEDVVTVVETYTTEVALDGEPDGTAVVTTVVGTVQTLISSLTQTIATATRTRSEVIEAETLRYYTRLATYEGVRTVSLLTSYWTTFVDRGTETATQVVDDYVIDTSYVEVGYEQTFVIPVAGMITEVATIPVDETTLTDVEAVRLEFVPPNCTTLTETTVGTQTTITVVRPVHRCKGGIYIGYIPIEKVNWHGSEIDAVRNPAGSHRIIR